MVTQPKRSSIDVRPFLFANSDLHSLEDEGGAAISRLDHYTWKSEPLFAWDWSEEVWVQRLFQCIECTALEGIKVVPAFRWSSNGYRSDINTHFPNVRFMRAAPSHGMTDLLLMAENSLALVHVEDTSFICSGIQKDTTCAICIASSCNDRRDSCQPNK